MNAIYRNAAAVISKSVSMTDIFAVYGIEVNRQGFALCPFHSEKTPSMKAYKNNTRFKCFGCGDEGDAISFVMKTEDISFTDAVRKVDALFCLCLFEKPTLRQHKANTKRVKDRQAEIDRREEKRQRLENEYLVRLKVYKAYCGAVERLKPPYLTAEPSAEFLHALKYRAIAEHNLDECFERICAAGGDNMNE